MSLTNRLLIYLLSLLALALVGFSLGIYLLASHYLKREVDERLSAAMNTLVGSLDIEPDTVEWEPADRDLSLPHGPLGEDVSWFITDIDGQMIEHSQTPNSSQFLEGLASAAAQPLVFDSVEHAQGWHYLHRRIKAADAADSDLHRARTQEEIEKVEYPSLELTVGISAADMRRATRNLAVALAGLSLALWAICFAIGRRICRRALRPVIRMAETARAMSSYELHQRLPAVHAGDELQALNEAFNGLLDRLEVSFQQQRRFTGDVSHQLRTPLTIIQGQAEVALRRERSSNEYADVLRTIRQQAGKLHDLVETLLFLARTESDSVLPTLEPINLAAWLAEFQASSRDSPRAADVSFENPNVRDSLVVEAHAGVLAEILKNLLDNALKYSSPGTPVTIRLRQTDDEVGITVEDRGMGVAEPDRQRLFHPFFRSDAAQRQGITGAGLGLSIVSRLASALNGRVEYETREPTGSAFTLWLPR